MPKLKQKKVIDVVKLQISGNDCSFDLKVKLNNEPSKRQSETQTYNMKELPVDILKNQISKFIQKKIIKPKSDTNFYICAFENFI